MVAGPALNLLLLLILALNTIAVNYCETISVNFEKMSFNLFDWSSKVDVNTTAFTFF